MKTINHYYVIGGTMMPFAVLGNFVRDFESAVNSCTYYNCINGETGRYLAYYAKEDI